MYKKILFLLTISYGISCSQSEINNPINKKNILTDDEKNEGWILLFDGKTLNGWHEFGKKNVEKGWLIKNGELIAFSDSINHSSDIITDNSFSNFEFVCEWKISIGGNSGIFYHIVENENFTSPIQTAPEYQLIDDIGFREKLEDWQKTGANYALHIPKNNKILKKVGEWNKSKIIVKDSTVEHYLNSEKILEFKQWTNEWNHLVENSKWKDYPNYGLSKEGKIGLQSHGNSVWFRNIKIKKLN
ncbi:MAG: DUF1080 domain-containing protein [Ignavibacteriae bacterium]|nr:DUF1080 domain-containing protein [Ignavibacteriota bacterium]